MSKVVNRTQPHDDNFQNNRGEGISGREEQKETSSKEGHRESTVDSASERNAHFVQNNDQVSTREVINRGVKSLPQNKASGYEETHIRGNNSDASFIAHEHTGRIPDSRNRHVQGIDLNQVSGTQVKLHARSFFCIKLVAM